jgi:hypothetical protein
MLTIVPAVFGICRRDERSELVRIEPASDVSRSTDCAMGPRDWRTALSCTCCALAAGGGARGVGGAVATTSSLLGWAACDAGATAQRFEVHTKLAAGESGTLRDAATGRCVGVAGCKAVQVVGAGPMGFAPVALDVCGGGGCGGANTEWKVLRSAACEGCYRFESALDLGGCLNVPDALTPIGGPDAPGGCGQGAECTKLQAWRPCADVNQFTLRYDPATRQLRPPPAGYPTNVWIGQDCPAGPDACCLVAEPCVAPCALPWSWGTRLLLGAAAAATLYLGGGALVAARRAPGSPHPPGLGLLPHRERWELLAGLVADGVALFAARLRGAARPGASPPRAGPEGAAPPSKPKGGRGKRQRGKAREKGNQATQAALLPGEAAATVTGAGAGGRLGAASSSYRGDEWAPPRPQLSSGARETGVKVVS